MNGAVRTTGATRSLALTLAATALLATGCGASGDGFRPGLALSVGDQEVSTERVDEVTSRYCDAIAEAVEGAPAPLKVRRQQVVESLLLRAAADGLAEEYGVEPAASYRAAVAQLRPQLQQFDEPTQDAIVTVNTANDYVAAVTTAVGHEVQPGGDDAAAQQAGEQELQKWIESEEIVVNPVYGVSLEGDDVDLSVASRDQAVRESTSTGAGLPESQRCG